MRKKSVGLIRSDQTFLLFEPFYCRLGQNDNFVFGIYTRSIQSKTNLYAKKTLLSDRGSGRHPSSGRRLQFRRHGRKAGSGTRNPDSPRADPLGRCRAGRSGALRPAGPACRVDRRDRRRADRGRLHALRQPDRPRHVLRSGRHRQRRGPDARLHPRRAESAAPQHLRSGSRRRSGGAVRRICEKRGRGVRRPAVGDHKLRDNAEDNLSEFPALADHGGRGHPVAVGSERGPRTARKPRRLPPVSGLRRRAARAAHEPEQRLQVLLLAQRQRHGRPPFRRTGPFGGDVRKDRRI